mmetsp:Transcript_26242/g.56278  ORF Transcript_26242/g.56278 Transcript_26242/m.56278 type:complete len:300 (-) Transcript_26242:67-966(-)|eukprot:CAMPEP_0201122586 /NCGR_PEP_ID=MMETSP0850-20130426/6185_1 /ASSEMBLY_ACC=CAM_ASM_000622 /TAXON_ID=183588 /ORGANISM="Pseudo-nitzschia fraudulenta, Strain WWA7" /LENGTH=299 /DNA_ID=CAMNT_0047389307 /DNA_START=180 /DNA_END=1079 /DNA_ORIENTATION=+
MTHNDPKKSLDQVPVVLPPMPSLLRTNKRAETATAHLLVVGIFFLLLPSSCDCFVPNTNIGREGLSVSTSVSTSMPASTISSKSPSTRISMVYNHDIRDPDMMEMMIGGQRYENVPLPDSMLDTTIFVGNLCEFAQDEDLSQKFRSVTNLQSLPACVARRPNSQSLEYGFVAFPTVEEKEAAIIRFHGVEFMGRRLKVEEILDHPRKGRVHVPEKLVTYVLGYAKKTPRGKNDFSLRKISNTSNSKRRGGGGNIVESYSSSKQNNSNSNTQGRRKGDRKQKRANQKKRRRRNRDQDFFY